MSSLDGSLTRFRDGRQGFFGDGAAVANVPNSALQNSSVTITAGTGMTGGGVVALGGNVTLNATGGATVVMDDTGATTYPTAPQTQGVWYGTGTRAQALAQGNSVVCMGDGATVGAPQVVSVGAGAVCSSVDSVAVGYHCNVTGQTSVAIGSSCDTHGFNNVTCLGSATVAQKAGDLCIGAGASTTGVGPGIAIAASGAVTVAAAGASDVYLPIVYNGVTYKLLLHS